ncbi:N-glycosylase/DNA lyase, partial [Thermovibrio sp.]
MEKLVEALKSFTLSDVREIEESDRQYRALRELYLALKDRELFFKLVLLNSLLSYQLQMRGEDYWEKFSSFFKERALEEFEEFLSLYNRRFLPSKLKRYKKALKCVNSLFEKYSLEDLGRDLPLLTNYLSKCMGQKKDAKTIVFAAKMFT